MKSIKWLKFILWRILIGSKLDRLSNNIRETVSNKINTIFTISDYIYFGYGTTIKYYRDKTMKNQDLDIIISRKLYNSDKFNRLISELGATSWHKFYYNDKLVIHKFLYNNAPVEFFIAETENKKETVISGLCEIGVKKWSINLQTFKFYFLKGKKYKLPLDLVTYIKLIYGSKWNKKIPTWRFTTKYINHDNVEFIDKKLWKPVYKE